MYKVTVCFGCLARSFDKLKPLFLPNHSNSVKQTWQDGDLGFYPSQLEPPLYKTGGNEFSKFSQKEGFPKSIGKMLKKIEKVI